MGFLSKAWGGIKKAVKTVARTAKKIAKKTAYALPGGKALWKLGTKVGEGAMKVVGKVVNALGPVGMIALSVLAPYAAPLWAAFGAAAGAAGGVLGSIGTAVYTAGNWVAGTMSAMSSGISKAIGTIAEGGFSGLSTSLGKAGSEAVKGFADAFTGKAGSAAVSKGATEALTQKALADAAGKSVWKQATDQIYSDVMGKSVGNAAQEKLANEQLARQSTLEGRLDSFTGSFQEGPMSSDPFAAYQPEPVFKPNTSLYTEPAVPKFNLNTNIDPASYTANLKTQGTQTSLMDKAGSVAKSLLSQSAEQGTSFASPVTSVGQGQLYSDSGRSRGGIGSGGGSLLSEAMLQMQQETQRRMAAGFGG